MSSQGSRVALILAALAVLVGGFFLARDSDDDGDDAADTPLVTTETETVPTSEVTISVPAPTTTQPTTTQPAAPAIETISVRDGKPVGGVQELRFDKGERVRFRVRSDVAEEVHVHGYDIAKDVAAGGSVTFSFDAEFDGKYEVELEHSAVQIASLTIEP
ncbi:MAG TPA: hypothetical protein VFZ89_05640 [Solirubrobacteraceae bacterium]